MIFSTQTPLSQYYVPPDFATGKTADKLAFLGYKPTGEQNTWGKISSWIPGVGVEYNLAARHIAKKGGAGDTFSNIKEDTDNRITKFGIDAAAALAAFGGVGALGLAGGAAGSGGAAASGAAGLGAAGAGGGGIGGFLAGNSGELLKTGLNMGLKFGGSLAFDQNDLITEGQYIYR